MALIRCHDAFVLGGGREVIECEAGQVTASIAGLLGEALRKRGEDVPAFSRADHGVHEAPALVQV
jgi:hypothetical protein